MKAIVTSMTGFEDAFVSMYLSKRSWNEELDKEIRETCDILLDNNGNMKHRDLVQSDKPCFSLHAQFDRALIIEKINKFNEWVDMLLKMGRHHITVLRFINISIMTQGMHRAGQDDIDAHAKRFENKIIRNSTRLATFSPGEMSDWYKDKIIPTDLALDILGINIPESFEHDGKTFIRSTNGYIDKNYEGNKDVMRGLYMESIPSDFISSINLCEWAHVYKQRNSKGSANPEVQQWAEQVMDQITERHPQITRDYIISVEN